MRILNLIPPYAELHSGVTNLWSHAKIDFLFSGREAKTLPHPLIKKKVLNF
jgi:hypothetical protein